MFQNIFNIIHFGLINKELDVNISYKNQIETFRYMNNTFYSYQEPIGFQLIINGSVHMYIYGKTAKYGHFISSTTSKHVGWLIDKCERDEYYKNNFSIINIDKNVITNKKDKGKKITEEIECPICYDIVKKGLQLHCGHKFCSICIKTWIKKKSNCPYCKTSLYI